MLTREEFQTIYEQGPEATFALLTTVQEQVAALSAQVKQLQDRLGQDSHNSSNPPSSDGFKKKTRSLRKPSGRKPGGQPGHQGCTLRFSQHPDALIPHTPQACCSCNASLAEVTAEEGERRQVFDLPPLRLFVTEHRTYHKVCPDCGHKNTGQFPQEVAASVQYGPQVQALAVYLSTSQLLPYARLKELFADLFDAPISTGTLVGFVKSAAFRLKPLAEMIREALCGARVAHFDETGGRIGARLHWLHVAGTKTLTYYAFERSRGKTGMDACGVLPHFSGRAVHDGWFSYAQYGCGHALCNAHHLRELTAVYQQEGQAWAKSMRSLLAQIKQAVERAQAEGRTRLHVLLEVRFEGRYKQLIKQGLAANPPPDPLPGQKGRVKQSKARNLVERLDRFRPEVLAFMYDFSVPFDNNLAERDIRMLKVQQKVSGGFRTREGADAFCGIRSYLSTLRKQGQHILSALEHVFRGTPLCPDLTG